MGLKKVDFHSKVSQYGNEGFVQREGQGKVRVLGGRGMAVRPLLPLGLVDWSSCPELLLWLCL